MLNQESSTCEEWLHNIYIVADAIIPLRRYRAKGSFAAIKLMIELLGNFAKKLMAGDLAKNPFG